MRPKHRPPTPPGTILREAFLKPRHLTQAALAARMGATPRAVRGIVNGRLPIDGTTASRLAKALGTSRAFWLGLQAGAGCRTGARAAAGLESDRRFITRVKRARASLRAGRGVRLEDL